MLDIHIRTIPHCQQRYDTCGDWRDDHLGEFTISEMGDWRREFCLAIHEQIEAAWCRWMGVSEKQVSDFDMHYAGPCDEPGDDRSAPYYGGHQFANIIERLVADKLGIHFPSYEDDVKGLKWRE